MLHNVITEYNFIKNVLEENLSGVSGELRLIKTSRFYGAASMRNQANIFKFRKYPKNGRYPKITINDVYIPIDIELYKECEDYQFQISSWSSEEFEYNLYRTLYVPLLHEHHYGSLTLYMQMNSEPLLERLRYYK